MFKVLKRRAVLNSILIGPKNQFRRIPDQLKPLKKRADKVGH